MIRHVARRLLVSVPILLFASFLSFLMVAAAGSPVAELRTRPGVSEDTVRAVERQFGLDKPVLVRYWDWLSGFLRGDWGRSISLGQAQVEVFDRVMRSLWITARLVVGAELLALLLGVAVGVLAALRRYSVFDHLATSAAFLMFAMPVFCVAVILKTYGIRFNDVLESVGLPRWLSTASPAAGGITGFGQLVGTYLLPTLTLMLISFAAYSRFQRAAMLESLDADFVRTARAKGLSRRRVVLNHALRTALIPVSTLFSLNASALFAGAIITEQVFGWRGMGYLLVSAIRTYDPYLLMGWLMVVAVLVVLFNLLADLLYGVLDPRIRRG